MVNGSTVLARRLGGSDLTIGLTVVAFGTSMPELAASVTAAWCKNADIAVGNIVGPNIFNVPFILGMIVLIRPIPYLASHRLDILLVIVSTAFLMTAMYTERKYLLERWEGDVFLAAYAAYTACFFIG